MARTRFTLEPALAALGKPVRNQPKLPRHWLSFAPQADLSFEHTASLEWAACHLLTLAAYADVPVPGIHVLPSLKSPGGTLTAIHRDEEKTILEIDSQLLELPSSALLKPWSIVGNEVPAGAAMADLVPKGYYSTWRDVIAVVGQDQGRRILREVWEAMRFTERGITYVPLDFFGPFSLQRPVRHSLQCLLQIPDQGEIRGPQPPRRNVVPRILANSMTWKLGTAGAGSLRLSGPSCFADLYAVPGAWKSSFE